MSRTIKQKLKMGQNWTKIENWKKSKIGKKKMDKIQNSFFRKYFFVFGFLYQFLKRNMYPSVL